jgi:type I restriction enzyme M protein
MYVLRRMDAVRADQEGRTRNKKMLDDARITEQRTALCEASGHAFYNTSIFTLRDLKSRGNRQQLLADFEVWAALSVQIDLVSLTYAKIF